MKVSVLALGALASAGWVFPEAKEDRHRDPHHPYPPHSSQHPTPVYGAAYAAQSSYMPPRPCHGQGWHSHPREDRPSSLINSLRVWLKNHNIMHYHPFRPSRPTHHPPPWLSVHSSAEPTTQINWYEPSFTDDDPSQPLSADELRAKIAELIKADDAQGGYIPTLQSGNIRVITSGPGYMHTRIFFPGVGRKAGDERSPISAGFVESASGGKSYIDAKAEDSDEEIKRKIQEAIKEAQAGRGSGRDQPLPEGVRILPAPRPAWTRPSWTEPEERITELNWRDPVFTDDDPSNPLSISELRAKVLELTSSESARGGYIPSMISGVIRVVKTGSGYTHTQEYHPGFGRKDGDPGMPTWMAGGYISSENGDDDKHFIEVGPEDDGEEIRRRIDAAIAKAKGGAVRVDGPPGPGWMRMRVGITASGQTVRLPPPVPMFPGSQVDEDGPVHMSDGEVEIIGVEWVKQPHREASGPFGGPARGGMRQGGEWRGIKTTTMVNGQEIRLSPPQELPAEMVEAMRQDDHVRVYNIGGDALMVGPAHGFEEPYHGGHPGGGLHGHAGWHHRRPQSFGGRLHRAMRNLRPAESLAMAFVLGAGLGSILHMFFMLTLLITRRIRRARANREKRRAKLAKQAAKRKAKRAAGAVRLEGEDVLCVLRAPEAEVEEALPVYEEDAVMAAQLAQEKV